MNDASLPLIRRTSVREAEDLLRTKPCVVRMDCSLEEATDRLTAAPGPRVICVVDNDDRLVGLVPVRSLFDEVFFQIVPDEFMASIVDYEDSTHVARLMSVKTVGDLMEEPVWVTAEDTVEHAFRLMHHHRLLQHHRLAGLPIVDSNMRVVGYVDQLDLLLVWLRASGS